MRKYLIIIVLAIPCVVSAQKTFTISGVVHDADNGEDLIGVSIGVANTTTGTTTNSYGFYSISLPAGEHTLRFS
ncbi:MAG: carboxypeptidase-like regulatory domain-containing protein, partial [Tannerella sp.]|nr:carboxypeptidase-like regulatory domain-containing protein [Tannerella sp.]